MKSDAEMMRALDAEVDAIALRIRAWIRRLSRELRLARAAHERETQISLYCKYECVGGPFDGELVRWQQPELSMYVKGGTYNHGPDHRLHFEQLPPISFAGDDPEC